VGFFVALGGVATAIAVLPFILLAIPPLIWYFLRLRGIFVATTRELKRLEGIGRSPIFAMVSESLNGIATIRSNDKVDYFQRKFLSVHDAHTRAFFCFVTSSRWFATQMDFLAFLLLSTSSLLAVLFHDQGWFQVDPSVLGLALTMLLQIAGTNFPWMVRQSAEVTNQMVSVERILGFGSLPSEARLEADQDDGVHKDWPSGDTSIVVKNFVTRYRSNLPPALSGVTFRIEAGQRVGVVGR
jgi:ABC-type multidrug transport system fused ATPase/permease subunit